jgi:hypothetical protein
LGPDVEYQPVGTDARAIPAGCAAAHADTLGIPANGGVLGAGCSTLPVEYLHIPVDGFSIPADWRGVGTDCWPVDAGYQALSAE